MRVIVSILAGAAALGLAPGLGAQNKTTAPKKESTKISAPERGCVTVGDRTECRFMRTEAMDSAMMKRPAIGVQLSATGTARDTLGVFVTRVTPKGPAENAGITEGDRLVSINGVDLRVNAADAGDDYAAGLPSRRLTREVGKLPPGSVVNLRVYSGGRTRDVRVTVGRASDLREPGPFGHYMDGMPGVAMLRGMHELEGMRMPLMKMQMHDFPRMRIEQMEFPRMLDKMKISKEKAEKEKRELEKK
ncbi:MAG: PDZ domain-containing protein [Gemmatimonadales bacterium]